MGEREREREREGELKIQLTSNAVPEAPPESTNTWLIVWVILSALGANGNVLQDEVGGRSTHVTEKFVVVTEFLHLQSSLTTTTDGVCWWVREGERERERESK